MHYVLKTMAGERSAFCLILVLPHADPVACTRKLSTVLPALMRALGQAGMTVMNTRDRNSQMGGEPLRFRLGSGSVIKGLDQVRACARDKEPVQECAGHVPCSLSAPSHVCLHFDTACRHAGAAPDGGRRPRAHHCFSRLVLWFKRVLPSNSSQFCSHYSGSAWAPASTDTVLAGVGRQSCLRVGQAAL